MYGLSVVTPPTLDAISVAEAKQHLQLAPSYTGEDAYLAALIDAATGYVETRCGIAIMSQALLLETDHWPSLVEGIKLPRPPLASVTSVKYRDPAGADTTWNSANYVVSTSRRPGTIRAAYGITWPATRIQPDSIRVTYVAGYSSPDNVPATIKHALRLCVGNMFEQRTSEITGSITASVAHTLDALLLQHEAGDEFTTYERVLT
jgi:uncharacterized phiE125 gp8 family phage protein